MKKSGLKRIRFLLFVVASFAAVPFVFNCFGYSIFIYLNSETESRIMGISQGACHLARQPKVDDFSEESMNSLQEGFSYFPNVRLIKLIDTERTEIFVESGHGLPTEALWFSSSNEVGYRFASFPWILIPLGLFVVALTIPKRIAARQSVEEIS